MRSAGHYSLCSGGDGERHGTVIPPIGLFWILRSSRRCGFLEPLWLAVVTWLGEGRVLRFLLLINLVDVLMVDVVLPE